MTQAKDQTDAIVHVRLASLLADHVEYASVSAINSKRSGYANATNMATLHAPQLPRRTTAAARELLDAERRARQRDPGGDEAEAALQALSRQGLKPRE